MMDTIKRIFNILPVRAALICVLAFFIVFSCPLMPMQEVYAGKSPALSFDRVTVRVGQVHRIRIKNIFEDQIKSMTVESDDPNIVSVSHEKKPMLTIRGNIAYEHATVKAQIVTKYNIAGRDKFDFSLNVFVYTDRELAEEGSAGRAPDYSKKSDWLYLPKKANKPVDTFFIYSTQYDNEDADAPDLAPMDDMSHRLGAQGVFRGQAPLFKGVTNVYAPYYRQTNMKKFSEMSPDQVMKYQRHEQKLDICRALDYYFEHYNNGRPFIIFGHSQGAMMTLVVLEDYMKRHPEYYRRMLAAYAIGFSVTKTDLACYPYLRFAQGARDTGVVVSWNTEGKKNHDQSNFVVAPVGSIAINPINWKRDETYAPASENLGSRVRDPITGVYSIRKRWGDARVDLERGVVVTRTKFSPNTKKHIYGTASYHSKDIALYYMNLRKNIRDRIRAYRKSHRNATAASIADFKHLDMLNRMIIPHIGTPVTSESDGSTVSR